MSGDQDDAAQAAIDRTERYRSQARAVATLTAAAAGALSAGLILDSTGALVPIARVSGLVSIVFLIAATGSFVVASLVHARLYDEVPSRANRFLRPWEAQFEAEKLEAGGEDSPAQGLDLEDFRKRSKEVRRLIARFMDVGMWLSTIAIASLIVALGSAVFVNAERVEVAIAYQAQPFGRCPSLGDAFVGTSLASDLRSNSDLLAVRVSARDCLGHGSGEISLLVDRRIAVITWTS